MSDFANLTFEDLGRLYKRYWKYGKSTNLVVQHRIAQELAQREHEGQSGYRSCPDCGADIYDDRTHVLDERDREMNGYLPCLSEEEYELEEQLYER